MEPTALPYRQMLANDGKAAVSLYNGDPGVSTNVLRLVEAAGGGVVDDAGPTLNIPTRPVNPVPVEVLPNTVQVNPTNAASTPAGATKLSLKGIVQWAKDNPGKAVAVGVASYLVLREVFKKSKR